MLVSFRSNKLHFQIKDDGDPEKGKKFNQCILPTVAYNLESWNLTKRFNYKSEAMQDAHVEYCQTWRDTTFAELIRKQICVLAILEDISKQILN